MPGLSYPFVYECTNCGAETTIERADARQLHTNPDSINALEIILQERGWLRDDIKGLLFCPDCAAAETDA
jgi:hypothetical protein